VNWSGDLQPTNDDPEGSFSAREFVSFQPDSAPVVLSCNDPEVRIVRGSECLHGDLNLMEVVNGTIYRDTHLELGILSGPQGFRVGVFGVGFGRVDGPGRGARRI
jgi:hypothetical protein